MESLLEHAADVGPLAVLSRFRLDFHACLTARADELCELADAVRTLSGLSLAPEHRRGHGALYDAVSHGRVDIGRLRRSLAGLGLPRAAGGRLVLAADVSNWLRPGAATSPERLFCHVCGRGKGQAQMIPGWPYSVVAALEPGRTSWTAVLDAIRLGPDGDETEVTAAQVREVITRLVYPVFYPKRLRSGGEMSYLLVTAAKSRGSAGMCQQLPKLIVRVRFPSPAPQRSTRSAAHAGLQSVGAQATAVCH